jgi:hypothetical protein
MAALREKDLIRGCREERREYKDRRDNIRDSGLVEIGREPQSPAESGSDSAFWVRSRTLFLRAEPVCADVGDGKTKAINRPIVTENRFGFLDGFRRKVPR